MTRFFLLPMTLLLNIALSCSEKPGATATTVNDNRNYVMTNATQQHEIPLLDTVMIRECLEEKGVIAVIRVETIRLNLKNTRSENIEAGVSVEKILFGNADAKVSIRSHTSKGNMLLKKGARYLVILSEDPSYAPLLVMEGYVPVSSEDGEQQIKQHEKIISDLEK